MKSSSDFEQAGDPPLDLGTALARFCDAGEYLQERALACTVAADDTDNLATLDFEVDVLERPELLGFSPPATIAGLRTRSAAERTRLFMLRAITSREHRVALTLYLVADDILLAEPLDADNSVVGHLIIGPQTCVRSSGSTRCRAP